jgi:hypothetical protein
MLNTCDRCCGDGFITVTRPVFVSNSHRPVLETCGMPNATHKYNYCSLHVTRHKAAVQLNRYNRPVLHLTAVNENQV